MDAAGDIARARDLLRNVADYRAAESLAQRGMRELAEATDPDAVEARRYALEVLAVVARDRLQWDGASHLYRRAMNLATSQRAYPHLAELSLGVLVAAFNANRPDEARCRLVQAERNVFRAPASGLQSEYFASRARLCVFEGKLVDAAHYAKVALDESRIADPLAMVGARLITLARYRIRLGQIDLASYSIGEASGVIGQQPSELRRIQLLIVQSELGLARGDVQGADDLLTRAEVRLEAAGFANQQALRVRTAIDRAS